MRFKHHKKPVIAYMKKDIRNTGANATKLQQKNRKFTSTTTEDCNTLICTPNILLHGAITGNTKRKLQLLESERREFSHLLSVKNCKFVTNN